MSTLKPKILVIDDESQIRKFMRIALTSDNYDVTEAETAREALRLAVARKPDLITLDLGLPDMDGQDLLLELREFSITPVIVVSAREDEAEKIQALDNGADDYMVKPFGAGELMSRIQAVMRRYEHVPETGETHLSAGPITIDFLTRVVSVNGRTVKLTPKEYSLFCYLAKNANKVLTHRQILKEIWGQSYGDDNQYLRVYIGQLRKKLEENPDNPKHIMNEQGVGYILKSTS